MRDEKRESFLLHKYTVRTRDAVIVEIKNADGGIIQIRLLLETVPCLILNSLNYFSNFLH